MLLNHADLHFHVNEALLAAIADTCEVNPLDYPKLAFLAYHYGMLEIYRKEVEADIRKGSPDKLLITAMAVLVDDLASIQELFEDLGIEAMLPVFAQKEENPLL